MTICVKFLIVSREAVVLQLFFILFFFFFGGGGRGGFLGGFDIFVFLGVGLKNIGLKFILKYKFAPCNNKKNIRGRSHSKLCLIKVSHS